jgi:hypothetical protein
LLGKVGVHDWRARLRAGRSLIAALRTQSPPTLDPILFPGNFG